LINIDIIIITKSTIFSSDIHKWHIMPDADKTWPNFKAPFKAAQKDIKKSQPTITADSLGFHEQANAATLVNQVTKRLTPQRESTTTITAESIAEEQMQQQLKNMANSTQQNQQMLDQMTALVSTVSTLQTQGNNNNHSHERSSGGDRARDGSSCGCSNNGRNTCGGHGSSRQPFKYCWTHRNCAHGSINCTTKSDGPI
jgi:hypothetical protein